MAQMVAMGWWNWTDAFPDAPLIIIHHGQRVVWA